MKAEKEEEEDEEENIELRPSITTAGILRLPLAPCTSPATIAQPVSPSKPPQASLPQPTSPRRRKWRGERSRLAALLSGCPALPSFQATSTSIIIHL
ncbi:hypothetical protein O3P69_009754 [Scylla paramamosain]|uniref:Uncharacterized protein n=1 Tax=Scylla paramamosain TaxID=85552 RepID=A0AAW0SLN0_SCYPA